MNTVSTFLLVLCCLAVSNAAWRCTAGPRLNNARLIDAGQGKVVALDSNHYPYFLVGSSWYRLSNTRFRWITVGPAGMWAADTSKRVHKWIGGTFRVAVGSYLEQLDAGGLGQVVGVGNYQIFCLRDSYASAFKGVGRLSWSKIIASQRYQSCSPKGGCWGVDRSYRPYHTQAINPSTCGVGTRRYVSGNSMKLTEISTDGSVFAISTSGHVYQRTGISSAVPYGTAWTALPLCMTALHVSYDLGTLWVVTTTGTVMKCTH